MTKKTRSDGNKTKQAILDAGVEQWPDITLSSIARAVDMTHAAVIYHFPTGEELKQAIAEYAVEMKNTKVIVQLIGAGHNAAKQLSAEERFKHLSDI